MIANMYNVHIHVHVYIDMKYAHCSVDAITCTTNEAQRLCVPIMEHKYNDTSIKIIS